MRNVSKVLGPLVLAAGSLAVPGAAAAAKPPSLKVTGFSVNQVYLGKGRTVPPTDSTNACYMIGGPSADPPSLTGMVYVHAVKIPKRAPVHYVFTTPWDTTGQAFGQQGTFDGNFKDAFFQAKAKNTAGLFGGPTGAGDYADFRMLPTGSPTSNYMAGVYSLKATVTVNGKKLTAHGKITLQCA